MDFDSILDMCVTDWMKWLEHLKSLPKTYKILLYEIFAKKKKKENLR